MKKIVLIFLAACAIVFNIHAQNIINGHEYVDLGLPSGTKWATCNIGANAPHEYGDYYAWGETTTKTSFTQDNSHTYGEYIGRVISKATGNAKYRDISGNAKYDAARANWGSSWRMPTRDEIDELYEECIFRKSCKNGINGYKVIGPNGNSIFLPAAGYHSKISCIDAGDNGYYWSSSSSYDMYDNMTAITLSFYHCSGSNGWRSRDLGFTIRPVSN